MNKLFTKIATFAIGAFMAVGVGVAASVNAPEARLVYAADNSVTVEIAERSGTLGWANAAVCSGWTDQSGKFTFSQNGGGNNAKFYTSDTTWRFYSGGTIIISSTEYEIISVSSSPVKTFAIASDKLSASCKLTDTTKFKSFTITYTSNSESDNDSETESGNTGSETETPSTGNSVSVEMSSFTATSANMDTVISYTTAKGGGTSNPAINGGQIRLYQNSAGTGGGYIRISAKEGYKITEVIIGSSMATKVAHTVDDETEKTDSRNLAANGKDTIALSNTSVTIYCMGTSSSSRLYVNYLKVTYVSESGAIATLTSITISGSMTKTEYTTADSWDTSGLTVTGHYDNETSESLTSNVTFNFYNSAENEVPTPKILGVGDNQTLKITATYDSVTSEQPFEVLVTITQALEYTLVTDPSVLTKGTQFILVGGTEPKAMLQEPNTANSASSITEVSLSDGYNTGSVASSASATVFTLDGTSGSWAIKNGENQLGFTGSSNNNMQFNSDQTDTFDITPSETENALRFGSKTKTGRYLQYNNSSPRFSNYNGGQMDIYMYAIVAEVTYGTTDHIGITALPETEFCVGEAFNTTGMTLIAYDNADEATANSKVVDIYTTSITAGTIFTEDNIGEKTITVTYTEGSTFTTTYTIYVYASATYELVTAEPTDGWAGTYIIAGTLTGNDSYADGEYAFRSSLENLDVPGNIRPISPITENEVTTVTTSQNYQVTIAPMAEGDGYSIKAMNGKYIGWNTADDNGLNSYDEPYRNIISYDTEAGMTIIQANTGEKGLSLNNSTAQFRYYTNAGVKLYKLTYSDDVQSYADLFLDTLSTGTDAVCDKEFGNTDIELLKDSWGALAELFQGLSNTNKEVFTQGTANENGDIVARTLALYDYIATKYGTQLESEACPNFDFMSRGITQEQSNNRILLANNSQNSISLIVIATVVMSGLIIGYFALRKRKEQ